MKVKRPTPKKLPSGSWRCQVTVNGKRISVTDEDPKIAQAKAIAIQSGLMEEEKRAQKSLTLEDAIEKYMASKGNVLSPATIRGYDNIRRNRFQSLIKKNIYTMTKKDVQEAVNRESKDVSAKTVYNAYGLIRAVLKDFGVDVFGVRLPQQVRPDKKYMQPEELQSLLAVIEGDLCEVAILLAVCLGMRTSEIMGLCCDCIDTQAKTITIRRTEVPDKNNKLVLKEGAKNRSSQRVVSCPDFIMDRIRPTLPSNPSARLFRFHRTTLLRHVHEACRRAGITDTTTHGLRHTNAAVMKHLGVDDSYAMKRGGWAEERTYKQTYSYVFASAATAADTSINQYFEEIAHATSHEKQ